MAERDVYFVATQGECMSFIHQGKKERISNAITPLKVIEEGSQLKILWGCSRWLSCEDRTCQYSQVAKGPKKS